MMAIGSVVSGLLVASAALAGQAPEAGCTPTFSRVSSVVGEMADGYASATASVLLVGCADRLAAVGEADVESIRAVLSRIVETEGMGLERRNDDSDFRQRVAELLNSAVGRTVVADVFFFRLSYADYAWSEEPEE